MIRTEQELTDFLRDAHGGAPPLEKLRCGRGHVVSNKLCSLPSAAELVDLAPRPPSGLTLYKFGSRSVVGSYVLSDGEPVVLKYYFPKSFMKHISHGGSRSRCHRSWISGLAFQQLGLPTPNPLMIAEWHQLGGHWLEKSFLATRQATGVSLFEWVKLSQHDSARMTAMADVLRNIFERMAEYRISHGDLKATNVIVTADDSPVFVDLDAVSFLSSPARWASSRQRDVKIFQANWNSLPMAAAAFRDVISGT